MKTLNILSVITSVNFRVMKKNLSRSLLLCVLLIACDNNDSLESSASCGKMVYEGISYDMHYATIQKWSELNNFAPKNPHLNQGDHNFYRIRLASSDNRSFTRLDIYTQEESLRSGEYYILGLENLKIGDYTEGRFEIVAASPYPFPGVTFESPLPTYPFVFEDRGNGNYFIRLSELPKDCLVEWEGKFGQ